MIQSTHHLWYQVTIHHKMKILLILIAVDVANGDELSLGYLPPPRAFLAGGDFNHNELPFDLPKEIFQSAKSKHLNINSENISGNKITENSGYDDSEEITTPVSYQDSFYTPSTTISYTQTTTMFPITEYSSVSPSEISTNFDNINETNNLDLYSVEYNTNNADKHYVSSDQPPISINLSVIDRMDKYNSTNNLKDISLNLQNKSSKYPIRKQSHYNSAAITKTQKNILTPESFSYSFDTTNGIHSNVIGTAQEGVRVKGAYSYTGEDGKLYMMEYTADENGFQPQGDHLPTPPPIPKEIQKVIEQAHKDKANGIFDDGSYSEEKYGYKNYMPQFKNRADASHFRTYDNALNNELPNLNKLNKIGTENKMNGIVNKGIITIDDFKKGYEYFPPQNSFELFENNALHSEININENYYNNESPELSRVDKKPVEDVKIFSSEEIITISSIGYDDLPENKAENRSGISFTKEPFSESYGYKENPLITVNNNKYTLDQKADIKEDSENIMTPSSIYPSTNYVDAQDLSKKPEDVSMLQIFTNSPIPAGPIYSSGLEVINPIMLNIPEYETVHDKNDLSPTHQGLTQNSQTESSPSSESNIGEEFNGPKQYQRYDANFGYYY